MILLPHDSVVAVLRGSGIPLIAWGSTADPSDAVGSPYYRLATDPLPDVPLPFVVYNIPRNNGPAHTFKGGQGYNEEFTVVVQVYGNRSNIRQLGTPYSYVLPQGSLIAFLDGLSGTPEAFSGDTFSCAGWYRKSMELQLSDQGNYRSPDGSRVYCVEAEYHMLVNALYPL